jgi:hypothetical protein
MRHHRPADTLPRAPAELRNDRPAGNLKFESRPPSACPRQHSHLWVVNFVQRLSYTRIGVLQVTAPRRTKQEGLPQRVRLTVSEPGNRSRGMGKRLWPLQLRRITQASETADFETRPAHPGSAWICGARGSAPTLLPTLAARPEIRPRPRRCAYWCMAPRDADLCGPVARHARPGSDRVYCCRRARL